MRFKNRSYRFFCQSSQGAWLSGGHYEALPSVEAYDFTCKPQTAVAIATS